MYFSLFAAFLFISLRIMFKHVSFFKRLLMLMSNRPWPSKCHTKLFIKCPNDEAWAVSMGTKSGPGNTFFIHLKKVRIHLSNQTTYEH